jgi:hypothetical protein
MLQAEAARAPISIRDGVEATPETCSRHVSVDPNLIGFVVCLAQRLIHAPDTVGVVAIGDN